jgi:hypothetical protein
MLNLGCWMFGVGVLLLFLAPSQLVAQVSPHVSPNGLAQLQVAQPLVDVSSPVSVTAAFDPPTVQVGGKVFFRATVDAAQESIQWPEQIPAPAELKFLAQARGQILEVQPGGFRPVTAFLYEFQATAAGRFTISNVVVNAYGRPLKISAAALEVVPPGGTSPATPRQLVLEVSTTNLYLGQPFRVRALLPASPANEIAALREIQLDGHGFMTDKTAERQSIAPVTRDGQTRPAFIYEATVTPIAIGPLELSAQGFTSGREFGGPVAVTGQVSFPNGPTKYDFLVSDPVAINVRPLPLDGQPPAFTGSIGEFTATEPRLSTNRLRVGEPVQLQAAFRSDADLTRFVPPEPPLSRDWQIIANNPPGSGFTLIPLTDSPRATPAIPFSAFDPARGKYVDLTIPPLPVTVTGESLPVEASGWDAAAAKSVPLRLSNLAPVPGRTAANLEPPQLRGWLVGAQFLPVLGFLALWQWDRRRRFLEAHPEIVRRRQARRALRREKRRMQEAAAAGDAAAFARHAANAMKIACAPHFPAHPRALVCADVLTQLEATGQNGRAHATVRRCFTVADAQYAAAPPADLSLLAFRPDLEAVLLQLEEKL